MYCENSDDKMKLGWNQDVLIKWCVKALNVLYDDRTLKCRILNVLIIFDENGHICIF